MLQLQKRQVNTESNNFLNFINRIAIRIRFSLERPESHCGAILARHPLNRITNTAKQQEDAF